MCLVSHGVTFLCSCSHTVAPMQFLPCSCSHAVASMQFLPCSCFHAVAPMKLLPCSCFLEVAPMQLLPHSCSHAVAPMQLLPCSCSHTVSPMQFLPCSCFHAVASMQLLPCSCSQAVAPMRLLPCSCSHEVAPMQLLPRSCSHTVAPTQLLPMQLLPCSVVWVVYRYTIWLDSEWLLAAVAVCMIIVHCTAQLPRQASVLLHSRPPPERSDVVSLAYPRWLRRGANGQCMASRRLHPLRRLAETDGIHQALTGWNASLQHADKWRGRCQALE